MSISGTLLVFSDEISELTGPVCKNANEPCKEFSFIAENVHRQCPTFEIEWIHKPSAKHLPLEIYLENGIARDTAFIDPHTGTLLGYKQPIIQFLMNLHYDLFFGQTGRWINGVGAACLMSMTVSGLIIWLTDPRKLSKRLKVNWKAPWKRVNRDAHSVVGIFAVPFLLIWSVSGFNFAYPEPVKFLLSAILLPPGSTPTNSINKPPAAAARALLPEHEQPALRSEVVARGGSASSGTTKNMMLPADRFDRLISMARATQPALEVRWIKLSKHDQLPIKVLLSPSDSEAKEKLSHVFLDPATNTISQVKTPASRTQVDNVLLWLGKLHFGTFAGPYSKCIWLILGTIPGALTVSGIAIWVNRKNLFSRSK